MADVILWTDDSGQVVALTPPGGMSIVETIRDLVPKDRPTFAADGDLLPNDQPMAAWRLGADGSVTVDAAAVLVAQTPAEIAPLQGRRLLRHMGILDQVDAWVQTLGPDAVDAWEYSTVWLRGDQLITAAAAQFGLDPDEFFRTAGKL